MNFRRVCMALTVIAVTVAGYQSTNFDTTKAHNVQSKKASVVPINNLLSFVRASFAAEDVGDATCNSKASPSTTPPAYKHGALSHFGSMFILLNVVFPSGPESALCHFDKSMNIDPDLSNLPVSVTKTFGTKSVTVSVAAPTESWAETLGYSAKGTVTVDDVTYMVIYWGGTGDSSKGFMIEAPGGLGSGSTNRATFAQWDRTNADAQSVKIYAAKWPSSSTLTNSLANNTDGAGVLFGTSTYNSTTKAMTANVTNLETRESGGNTYKCYKMVGSGTKDGQISVAKETSDLDKTDTNKDSTGMEGVSLPDSTDTQNICQNNSSITDCNSLTASELSTLSVFQYSCNDLNTAGDSGGVFANDTVDASTCPAVVFEGASGC